MLRPSYLASLVALGLLLHCSSDSDGTPNDDGKPDAAATGDDDDQTGSGDDDDDTPPKKDGGGSSSSGSSGNDASTSSSSGGGGDGGNVVDYSVKGPHEVTSENSTTGNEACDVDVVRYRPTSGEPAATIVLEHGYLGDVADLADVGEHLASWGFGVVAVSDCDGSDHAANGKAMSDLADALEIPAPYFGGFSAGGLAGFLAAKQNARAAGYVGLDPVDASDLGKDAAPLSVPVRAVLTEPSSCNATSNFEAALTAQGNAKAVRVVGATHFDAVGTSCSELSFTCFACGPSGDERHATILAFATAALLEISGADATAGGYFTPGQPAYDDALADGKISAP